MGFAEIGAEKIHTVFMGLTKLHSGYTTKPENNLKVTNASVNSMFYCTEFAICNLAITANCYTYRGDQAKYFNVTLCLVQINQPTRCINLSALLPVV
jgi:hypothetical protein